MPSRTRWPLAQLKATFAWAVRHPHYKLLSIAVAVSGWMYVQGKQVVNERVRAEVEWITPVALLSTQELPSTISINVEGSLSAVRKARRAEVTLLADLSESTVGEATVDFASLSLKGLPTNVKATAFAPSSIRFVLDEADTRKVKVLPRQVGDLSPGYAITSVVLEPSVVEIIGPRVTVAELGELHTKPIDISGVAGNSDLPAEVDLPRGIELTEEVEILARVEIQEIVDIVKYTGVRVAVDQVGWIYEPKQVTVRLKGPAEDLRRLRRDDLIVVARLPEAPTEDRYLVSHGPTEGVRLDVTGYEGDRLEETVIPQTVEVWKP